MPNFTCAVADCTSDSRKRKRKTNQATKEVVVVACCQQLAADDIVPESVKCATQYCVFYVLLGLFCCLLHSSEIIYQYTSVDNSMK